MTLIESSEGKQVSTKTNSKGEYLFPVVAIGNYQLKVTAPTFQGYIVNDLQVNAAANVRQDARMQAGEVAAEVTVQAATHETSTPASSVLLK